MSTTTQLKNETGPWDESLAQLQEWDPVWAELCVKMSTNPWTGGVLSRKFVELISLALNASCTNLNADGTRRHIRGALDAGASREEILMVLKMAFSISIHSCSFGAQYLFEEANAAGVKPAPKSAAATPVVDKMRAMGLFSAGYEPVFQLDPAWTEQFMTVITHGNDVFTKKEYDLLWIAFDASFTHMYAPGTPRHIKSALRKGATMEEIMEVLKICVAQGVQTLNLGVPILAEELTRQAK
jgi:alkylhydroperoxidase/carboxymuconolactone decarboxylase family protein YurZ